MSNKITLSGVFFTVNVVYDREHGVHSRSRPHIKEIEVDDSHFILRDSDGKDVEITPLEEISEYHVKISDQRTEPERDAKQKGGEK